MRKIDLAYAAGIIDGEGCIFIAKTKKETRYYYWLQINVETTDSILAPWFGHAFGGHSYIKEKLNSKYHAYHWSVCSTEASLFLKSIIPYLKLKKEQAKIAIAFQEYKNIQGHYWSRARGQRRPAEFYEKEKKSYLDLRRAKNNYRKKKLFTAK